MPTIRTNYPHIDKAENIESILCLATLIATKTLSHESNTDDSNRYYQELGIYGCSECPFNNECLACIINE